MLGVDPEVFDRLTAPRKIEGANLLASLFQAGLDRRRRVNRLAGQITLLVPLSVSS